VIQETIARLAMIHLTYVMPTPGKTFQTSYILTTNITDKQ